jgi:hypothetical protein
MHEIPAVQRRTCAVYDVHCTLYSGKSIRQKENAGWGPGGGPARVRILQGWLRICLINSQRRFAYTSDFSSRESCMAACRRRLSRRIYSTRYTTRSDRLAVRPSFLHLSSSDAVHKLENIPRAARARTSGHTTTLISAKTNIETAYNT